MLLRIADGVMVPLFLLSVAVQYNDPDPVRWMAIYLAAGIVSFVSAWKTPGARRLFASSLAVGAVAAAWALTILPRVVGTPGFPTFSFGHGMENETIEETRELGGLVITATWMAVVAVRGALARRRQGGETQ